MTLHCYTDSDWAGCRETRRSADRVVVVLGGAVVLVSTQTQVGLPATPSSDAETRGMSRGARDIRQLAEFDFGLKVKVKPKLLGDNSAGLQVAKKLGPGTKLRHLEVADMYV